MAGQDACLQDRFEPASADQAAQEDTEIDELPHDYSLHRSAEAGSSITLIPVLLAPRQRPKRAPLVELSVAQGRECAERRGTVGTRAAPARCI
ncbi:hypothetical protein Pen01_10720 [Phytomonospora endophytica]|nr:hypothetical protein Pen01_10720 [Phytomonospora endophytica]